MELSVVVPARDEAPRVAELVRGLLALDMVAEVVVVDDGSADGTAVALAALPPAALRVLRNPRPLGYGAAVARGFAAARGRWVALLDGDLQFRPRALRTLWEARGGAELVVGVRHPRRDPWLRRATGRGWNLLLDVAVGHGLRDVDCGCKLVLREALGEPRLVSRRALVGLEICARVRAGGGRVREVPVEHHPRPGGRATGLDPGVILGSLGELLRVGPALRRPQQRQRGLEGAISA